MSILGNLLIALDALAKYLTRRERLL